MKNERKSREQSELPGGIHRILGSDCIPVVASSPTDTQHGKVGRRSVQVEKKTYPGDKG